MPETTVDDRAFLQWLIDEGYTHPLPLPDGRYACLQARAYNTRIITGRIGDRAGYSTAW